MTLQGGSVTVQTKHGSETHVNTVSIMELNRRWLGDDFVEAFQTALALMAEKRMADAKKVVP